MSTISNGRAYRVCSSSRPDSSVSSCTGVSAKTLVSSGSATTRTSSSTRTATYVTSGCTATAVLEINVQGVVVQTSSAAPSSASDPSSTGKRTIADGSVTS